MNSSIVLQANVVRSQFCTYLSRQHFKMISTNVKYAQPLVLSSSALCSSILFQENNIINENVITRKLPPNPNNMQPTDYKSKLFICRYDIIRIENITY